MPDWNGFRERLQQGDMRYKSLLRIREFAGWLDLSVQEAPLAAQKHYEELTDQDAREVFSGLLAHRYKLLRDGGIVGSDAEINEQLNELFKLVDGGGGSPEQKLSAKRLWNLQQIVAIVVGAHPAVVQPVTADSVAADKA